MLKRFEAVLSRLPGNHRLPNRKILPQQKNALTSKKFFETEEYGLQQVVHFRNSCIPSGYICIRMRKDEKYEQPGTD